MEMLTNPVLATVSMSSIFASWLVYLFAGSLREACQNVQAGADPESVRGGAIFPLFPIFPTIVALCLWSLLPILSPSVLFGTSFAHLLILWSSALECAKLWKKLHPRRNNRSPK